MKYYPYKYAVLENYSGLGIVFLILSVYKLQEHSSKYSYNWLASTMNLRVLHSAGSPNEGPQLVSDAEFTDPKT